MEELAGLPDRMAALELQIVQFRAEVRAEFSATREELRQEFRQELRQLRGEMVEGDEEIAATRGAGFHIATSPARAALAP